LGKYLFFLVGKLLSTRVCMIKTLPALLLALFTCIFYRQSVAQSSQLSQGTASYSSAAVIGNTLYVAFWDDTSYPNGSSYGSLTIRKLNASGNGWETVGPPDFYSGTASPVNFAYKGTTPYIVYSGGIQTLNSAGTAWKTLPKMLPDMPGFN
jgi:Flp pilus assembly protein TadG